MNQPHALNDRREAGRRTRAIDKTDLNWTYIGFADDTPEQGLIRHKQNNLVGPAGYISMEGGCVGSSQALLFGT